MAGWLKDGRQVKRKKKTKRVYYSPNTANSWLSILRSIINAYVFEYERERNPILGIENFATSEHSTYTDEEPNSLLPEEVPLFLAKMLELHPRHYALVALGFGTGLRSSSLRPLRRRGSAADVLWDKGVLLVRRSHTRRQEVMETTKTRRHQRLKLPPEDLMDILRWHVDELTPKRCQSNLLFPPRWGDGFMSASALDKPFREVSEAQRVEGKLSKRITPRGMRRTFQDLAREAQVKDVVTRAISGHATEQMQRHYSTVNASEVEVSIGKIISLAKAKELLEEPKEKEGPGGADGGADGSKTKKSASRA